MAQLKYKDCENLINFKRLWKRYTMYEAIEHFTGVDISEMDEATIAKAFKDLGISLDSSVAKGKLIDEILGKM